MRGLFWRWLSAMVGMLVGLLLYGLQKACRSPVMAHPLIAEEIEDEVDFDGEVPQVKLPPVYMVPLAIGIGGVWHTFPWHVTERPLNVGNVNLRLRRNIPRVTAAGDVDSDSQQGHRTNNYGDPHNSLLSLE